MNSASWNFATFQMEAPLESGRFGSRWNAGESGAPAQTLNSILTTHATANGLDPAALLEDLAQVSLADSPNHGRADLREHVARLHPGASAKNVLITTGTSEALFLLFLALRPRKVAMLLPGFQLLSELVTASGAQLVPLPMRWDEAARPVIDDENWLQIIHDQSPDLILLNHPHNPSGSVFHDGFLQDLQEYIDRSGANLIGDEHYRFLCNGYQLGATIYRADGELHKDSRNLNWRSVRMVTGSFIKCLGTPGLRIGWCVAPEALVEQIQNLKNYTTHTVNPVSEWLAERILRSPELSDFSAMREIWQQNCATLHHWSSQQQDWLVQVPTGGWVTCLTHRAFPKAKPAISSALSKAGCFLLDLEFLEISRFGDSRCKLKARGGYRLGLGMNPSAFANMLDFLAGTKAP